MGKYLLSLLLFAVAACQTVPADDPVARKIAVLKENGFREVGDEWHLGMSDRLLFKTDENKLATEQIARLDGLARTLLSIEVRGARVEGNTDSTGTPAYNLTLSQKRAEAVRDALVAGGMDSAGVVPIGRGMTNPIESNKTAEGRRENRRVVIIVSSADLR